MANVLPNGAPLAPLFFTQDLEDGPALNDWTFRSRVRKFVSSINRPSPLSKIAIAFVGLVGLIVITLGVFLASAFVGVILALCGALELVAGHAILRTWAFEGYIEYSLQSSMKIGAAGALLLYVLGFALVPAVWVRVREQGRLAPSFCAVAYGAGVGLMGSGLLGKYGSKGLMLDPVHAAVAGTVGGVAVGLGWIVVLMVFLGTRYDRYSDPLSWLS